MIETSNRNKNLSNKNSKKKTEAIAKKTYPQAKLFSQYNPYYPKKKSIIEENTSASYCKFKRGFLHLVKNSSKLGA